MAGRARRPIAIAVMFAAACGDNNSGDSTSPPLSTADPPRKGVYIAINPAVLEISDATTYDYGTRLIGSSIMRSFTVTNVGGSAATLGIVTTATLELSAPFALTGGTCVTGATIDASSACTLDVAFAPTDRGPASDLIKVGYNDGVAVRDASRALAGTGAAPARLEFSDATIHDFGMRVIGAAITHTLTVTNVGDVSATLGTVTSTGLGLDLPFSHHVASTCSTGMSIGVGLSCTLDVTFAPTARGDANDTIELGYDDGLSTQVASRGVTGVGANPARLEISDAPSFDYGSPYLGTVMSRSFTVTNTGEAPALLGGLSTAALGLAAPFSSAAGSCKPGGLLAPTSSCTLEIRFAPMVGVEFSDEIVLSYDDGLTTQEATCALQGAGTRWATTVQFGTSGLDVGHSVATDKDGNVYLAGYTGGNLAARPTPAGTMRSWSSSTAPA